MRQGSPLWLLAFSLALFCILLTQPALLLGVPNGKKCSPSWFWNGDYTGAGDGSCGVCENKVRTRTIGSCVDGECDDNCVEDSYFTRMTQEYSCHPPGTAGLLGCYTLGVACGATGIVVCAGVCTTAGVWTGETLCYACIAGALAGGGVCACLVNECLCPCDWDRQTLSDYMQGCLSS